jgi:CYTH domain-containing protein
VLAEIELSDADETIEFPSWIGDEVTHDPTYLNVNLINRL